MNFSSATIRLVVAVVAAGGASALCQQTIAANASLLAGGLNGPRGLAFGSDGSLYVAEAGTGGTVSTASTSCLQVPPPVLPYLGGSSARISKIDPSGNRVTVASGLPSSVDAMGDLAETPILLLSAIGYMPWLPVAAVHTATRCVPTGLCEWIPGLVHGVISPTSAFSTWNILWPSPMRPVAKPSKFPQKRARLHWAKVRSCG